ncbi:HD domain-containing protein [Promineifilum sp.]|uniref:HD domain-containing protein n=1 Tax=Promineifilum sp. TaxID=2664178 RepID=UPI0035AD8623
MNEILIHNDRLRQQVGFLIEIDRLKHVLRRSRLADGSRQENSAEHSWHLAVAALLLAEHADRPVDLARVVKMALIHDIVEIDAGDTFFYDAIGALDKADREARAADRLFGLLPPDQTTELRALWDEFEARRTPEACFAYALDRFLPLLHNYLTGGQPWRQHGVRGEQVMAMTEGIVAGSAEMAACARALVADAMAQGFFDPIKER